MVTFTISFDDERMEAITSPQFAIKGVENLMTSIMFTTIKSGIEKGEISDIISLDEILEEGHEGIATKLTMALCAAFASIEHTKI